jgi:hypothetical protein
MIMAKWLGLITTLIAVLDAILVFVATDISNIK